MPWTATPLFTRGIGDVEIIDLRAGRESRALQFQLQHLLDVPQPRMVVAGPDDLQRACDLVVVERLDDLRIEPDRSCLMLHVGSLRIAQEPFGLGEEPGVDALLAQHGHRRLRGGDRNGRRLDHAEVWPDDRPAIDRTHGRGDAGRRDDALQADRGACARHGEVDATRLQGLDRGPGPRGDHLSLGHQRSVDVRNHQPEAPRIGHGEGFPGGLGPGSSATGRLGPPAILGEHRIRRGGTRAAGDVVREILRRGFAPGVEHRLDDAPTLLDLIGALEQRLVADHDVVEKRLVADVLLRGEPVRYRRISS